MFDLNLNKHLDSDEKMILFFRPSRKAYLFQYILIGLVFVASVVLTVYSYHPRIVFFRVSLFIVGLVLLILSLIMLGRVEYRIWSRRYGITNERVMHSRGIFNEHFKSARYSFITDTSISQTFWDKIMNTGTLKVDTAGTDFYEFKYRKISDPVAVSKMINDQIPDKNQHGPPQQPVPKKGAKIDLLELNDVQVKKPVVKKKK